MEVELGRFVDSEHWRCERHPYRRCSGVCAACLHDRLRLLCPECAAVLPSCSCLSSPAATSASSSPASSPSGGVGVGAVGRVSDLIGGEPLLRRSRSFAIPFLRTGSTTAAARDRSGEGTRWLEAALRGFSKVSRSRSVAANPVPPALESLPAALRDYWIAKPLIGDGEAPKVPGSRSVAANQVPPALESLPEALRDYWIAKPLIGDGEAQKVSRSRSVAANPVPPALESLPAAMRDSWIGKPWIGDGEAPKVSRSRSVAANPVPAAGESVPAAAAAEDRGGWFSNPLKVLRSRKSAKVVQERSPCRRS